jgi:hypothetical protein
MKHSIHAQIEEVERELAHRRQVYPSLVRSRSMRQSIAELQIDRLEAVRATLIWLRDNEAEIRTIMAERRKADPDPNDAYAVIPMPEEPRGPKGWWTVTRNGTDDRHFHDRDKADRYASDPAYREQVRRGERKHHNLSG